MPGSGPSRLSDVDTRLLMEETLCDGVVKAHVVERAEAAHRARRDWSGCLMIKRGIL